MAFGMAIAGRHGMAQAGQWGMRLGVHEGWVVVFSGGFAYFRTTLATGDEIYVDWGDGTTNTYTGSGTTLNQHTYADNAEYTVKIYGTALKVWFQALVSAQTLVLKRVLPCNPVKLLRNNDISNALTSCSNLVSVSGSHFSNIPTLTTAANCFLFCTSLTSLPIDLFSNTPELTNLSLCFQRCSVLTSLPAQLFIDTPLLTNANACFKDCRNLTSLPSTLFSNIPALAMAGNCFDDCRNLTSLPSTLFSNTPLLETAQSCFYDCSGLTSIPSAIFSNAPALTNLGSCFRDCPEVSDSIPALWTNPNITSYNSCYYNTGKQLTAPPTWTHSVDNICGAACSGWTGGQWTGEDYCNC